MTKHSKHNWNFGFGEITKEGRYGYYRCEVCDEWKRELIIKVEKKGYYEGDPLTKV